MEMFPDIKDCYLSDIYSKIFCLRLNALFFNRFDSSTINDNLKRKFQQHQFWIFGGG